MSPGCSHCLLCSTVHLHWCGSTKEGTSEVWCVLKYTLEVTPNLWLLVQIMLNHLNENITCYLPKYNMNSLQVTLMRWSSLSPYINIQGTASSFKCHGTLFSMWCVSMVHGLVVPMSKECKAKQVPSKHKSLLNLFSKYTAVKGFWMYVRIFLIQHQAMHSLIHGHFIHSEPSS